MAGGVVGLVLLGATAIVGFSRRTCRSRVARDSTFRMSWSTGRFAVTTMRAGPVFKSGTVSRLSVVLKTDVGAPCGVDSTRVATSSFPDAGLPCCACASEKSGVDLPFCSKTISTSLSLLSGAAMETSNGVD